MKTASSPAHQAIHEVHSNQIRKELQDLFKFHSRIYIPLNGSGRRGMRYHAKEKLAGTATEWAYTEEDIPMAPTGMLLVRIMIGKVEDKGRLVNVIRTTPIRDGQSGWNCVIWVKEVIDGLRKDGKILGTSVLEWERIRVAAMNYCQKKRDQHRFDGTGSYDQSEAPTYDLIEERETIV